MRTSADPDTAEVVPCYGPLEWHGVGNPEDAAVLECAADNCGYLVATGAFNDERHALTPISRA